MKTALHDIRARWTRALRLAGRARARRELLRQSERALADAGFSRELLETGTEGAVRLQ